MKNEFHPDVAFPPGETLQEMLDALEMTQAQLSNRMGRPKKTINGIIKGEVAITPDTAIQLERVLGMPAGFWNTLEYKYQEYLARLREQEALAAQARWLKEIPVADMARLGWIEQHRDPARQVQEILTFFGVASLEQFWTVWANYRYHVELRKSDKSVWGSIYAWLRMGEISSRSIEVAPYDPQTFQKALFKIRALTVEHPDIFVPEVKKLCSEAGVAVVFVPQLPETRSSSAARWLTPKKALIQVSLRYRTDDQIWFSFFHEAAHILLHGKRPIFLDGDKMVSKEGLEEKANQFAADFLIRQDDLKRFVAGHAGKRVSKVSVSRFAESLGIAPGILVGRLQHEGYLPYSYCNVLKRKFRWVNANDK